MSAARPWIVGLVGLALTPALSSAGAWAAPPEPAAHAAKTRSCRTPFMVTRTAQGIRASGIGCRTAVKVAVAVGDERPGGCVKRIDAKHIELTRPCVRRGFRCTAKPHLDGGVLNTTCKRRHQTIRFQY